LILLEYLFN